MPLGGGSKLAVGSKLTLAVTVTFFEDRAGRGYPYVTVGCCRIPDGEEVAPRLAER